MPLIKSRLTQRASLDFTALGTEWRIDTDSPLKPDTIARIRDELDAYEKIYSRFRDDSLVAQMAQRAGVYTFPPDFEPLFRLYMLCYRVTGGAMTPLIGRALEQLGYDKNYSLQQSLLSDVPVMADVLSWDKKSTLTTKQPIVFDIGAAGKGQAVDRVAAILADVSVVDCTIDASGDIYHSGSRGEVIGLEHPGDPTKVIGTAMIKNQSLCASASNRRAWNDVHHIVNAHTLQPVQTVVATWVIADSAMVADGLATALFFVESAEDLQEDFDFSYVRMFANGMVDYSTNFEGELFT